MRRALYKIMNASRVKSPWLLHFDASGCNGCAIEMLACLAPRHDLERFGIVDKGNPRHADVLLLSGAVSKRMRARLKRVYEQMAEPRVVVVVGSCGTTKGVYDTCYNLDGPIDRIIPVDVYVQGCPPRPEAIIHGIHKGLEVWKEKLEKEARK